MRVHVKFLGLPNLSEAVGAKEMSVDLAGKTVRDLVQHIVGRHGARARGALFDDAGELDLTIQLLLNEKEWISRDRLDTRLSDGDSLYFMFLAGGG